MSLKFKSYDPVRHQQRAERRRQKRSAERSTFVPSSATSFGTPPPQCLIADLKCSRIDEKFIPSTNPVAPEDPYSGYPSVGEILEFCSSLDTDVSSVYTPTSANPLSYPDSDIDIQDVSLEPRCQEEADKDDRQRRKLLRAIGTILSTSELNIGREAYDVNASGSPAFTTVSEESNTGISLAKHALSLDAETSPTASSISTPASVISPIYQKQTSIWRNQDSFVNNEVGAQDSSTEVPDLGGFNPTSKDALPGVGLPVLECQNNTALEFLSSDSSSRLLSQDIQALPILASAASTMEPSLMEPSVTVASSVKKMPAQVAISSSTKRSFSESGATDVSQPSVLDACHPSKRPRFTSTSSKEAISTLLDIQTMISNLLAKLNQDQPHRLIPDVSVNSMSDTIEVAVDRVYDNSSDDSSSTCSSFDDSEGETELTTSQPRGLQYRSTQRRRWIPAEEKLLRRLKSSQKRNGMPSDFEIASKLDRTESGVKQHWEIMLQKNRRCP